MQRLTFSSRRHYSYSRIGWYSISFIPFARDIVKKCCMTTCCGGMQETTVSDGDYIELQNTIQMTLYDMEFIFLFLMLFIEQLLLHPNQAHITFMYTKTHTFLCCSWLQVYLLIYYYLCLETG